VTFTEGKLKALLLLTQNFMLAVIIHMEHELSVLENLESWN
jgi:hypothetical protein